MFPIGSDAMYPHTRQLLEVVAQAIAELPNRVSIRGHTDALPFAAGAGYDNWRLSADRANATRAWADRGRAGDPGGWPRWSARATPSRCCAVDPDDPRNRRISVVLLQGRSGQRDRDGPPRQAATTGGD